MDSRRALLAKAASIYARIAYATKRLRRWVHRASSDYFYLKKPCIYLFWHCDDLLAIHFFRGNPHIHPMASLSADGDMMIDFLRRYDLGTQLRGSEGQGSLKGIRNGLRLIEAGDSVALSLDGSRGPRFQVKRGPLLLARKSGCPVICLGIFDNHSRTLARTWDQNNSPLPNGAGTLVVDRPWFPNLDPKINESFLRRRMFFLKELAQTFTH